MWMLDTNTCSFILRKHPLTIKTHFDQAGKENIAISSIVLAELYFGAARHPKSVDIRSGIDDLVRRLWVIPWDRAAASHYGEIRSHLERMGIQMDAIDMLIAAHARSLDAILVTSDIHLNKQIPGLMTETWG